MLPGQFEDNTSQANAQMGKGMGTVEKTRCQLAYLRAGARFSTPQRVDNTALEFEFEVKDQGFLKTGHLQTQLEHGWWHRAETAFGPLRGAR